MGRIMSSLILLALPWLSSTSALSQQPAWVENYEQAKERALKENKLILVDFWAGWCEPCVRMDRQTWSQWQIVVASQKFVCLRLDYDRRETLASWFDVGVVPTVVILDAFGTKMADIAGFKSADEMLGILKPLPANMLPVYSLLKRLETAPDSIELHIALGDHYHRFYLPERSNACYEAFLDKADQAKNPKLEAHVLTGMALNHQALGNQDKARELLEQCLSLDADSAFRPLQLYLLTRIYLSRNEDKKAKNTLETLRKEFPRDKHRSMAEELFRKL